LVLVVCLLPHPAQAANLEVEAKSALLMDVATGTVLFEQNSHEALAPASVTKVMTMLLIMEAIDNGKIGWSDTVTASEAVTVSSQRSLPLSMASMISSMVITLVTLAGASASWAFCS
jgi:D-alanyl-D-alanine carboxypeptidase